METLSLEKEVSELLTAHEGPFHIDNEWVVPWGKLPAIRSAEVIYTRQ